MIPTQMFFEIVNEFNLTEKFDYHFIDKVLEKKENISDETDISINVTPATFDYESNGFYIAP